MYFKEGKEVILLYIQNLALTRFTHHNVFAEDSLFANERKQDYLVVLISSLETLLKYLKDRPSWLVCFCIWVKLELFQ